MKNEFKKTRIILCLLSVLYIISGAIGIIHPLLFSVYLISVLGAFFLLNGFSSLFDGIKNIKNHNYHWGMSLFLGLMEIILSISIFMFPLMSELYLVMYIGMLILIKGIFIICSSFSKRSDLKTPHTSTGIISILFGFLLVVSPVLSDKLIILMVAWFIIFSGIDLFVIAMGMKNDQDE